MHGGGPTSAPPPTPSTQTDSSFSTSAAADALSNLLHRLPPTLSLPTRRSHPAKCPPLPTLSFSDALTDPSHLSSASQLGFFQLSDHSVASQLAHAAESEALTLFDLPRDKKESLFPKSWPLGFEEGDEKGDEDDDVYGLGDSLCLDESCYTESTELSMASLREFSRALEKVGVEMIELLCSSVGFESPVGKGSGPTRFCSMMWVSEGLSDDNTTPVAGRFYPYIVGLQYQIQAGQKYSLMADSGWVSVLPQVESLLVTIGDIAQVWSNAKLKKVRGRPVACLGGDGNISKNSRCITMSLQLTLPIDSRICPLVPVPAVNDVDHDHRKGSDQQANEGDNQINNCDESGSDGRDVEGRLFKSFCLEDYAWRVYHERLHFRDPLDRLRIKD